MTPTIMRRGASVTVLGGAGSDRIPSTLIDVISNMVDRSMGLKEAVVAPRVMWNSASDPPRVCLEIAGPISDRDGDRLQSYGFEHMFRLHYPPEGNTNLGFFGGVNAVSYDGATGVFHGVGDPRRTGFALGPRVVAERPARRP
jgi:gamma-glutamyltranspeptidase/glutathione hydrolase